MGINSFVNIYTFKWNLSGNLIRNLLTSLINEQHQTRNHSQKLLISQDELNSLLSFTKNKFPQTYALIKDDLNQHKCNERTIRNLMTPQAESMSKNFLEEGIVKTFQAHFSQKKPLFVTIILMESTRAVDSSLYFPEIKGHTPHLDEISKKGILIKEGRGLSNVSRAAGESIACHSLASIYYNAMRNTPQFQPLCAKDLFFDPLSQAGIKTSFQWFHGGYQSFDNQNNFWSQHDFSRPLDIMTYPRTAPRTEWGLSDRILFAEASKILNQINNNKSTFNFSVISTISNHYNWSLPPDADSDLQEKAKKGKSPKNFLTLEYQDRAIGEFVNQLKTSGVWSNSLVIFVGDHGIEEESAFHKNFLTFDKDEKSNQFAAKILTHIYFSLSGGIVEDVVQDCFNKIEKSTSQADIIPTISQLLRASLLQENSQKESYAYLGESIFQKDRKTCVLSDLGEVIITNSPLSSEKMSVATRQNFFAPQEAVIEDLGELCNDTRTLYKMYLNLLSSNELGNILKLEVGKKDFPTFGESMGSQIQELCQKISKLAI